MIVEQQIFCKDLINRYILLNNPSNAFNPSVPNFVHVFSFVNLIVPAFKIEHLKC